MRICRTVTRNGTLNSVPKCRKSRMCTCNKTACGTWKRLAKWHHFFPRLLRNPPLPATLLFFFPAFSFPPKYLVSSTAKATTVRKLHYVHSSPLLHCTSFGKSTIELRGCVANKRFCERSFVYQMALNHSEIHLFDFIVRAS